MSSDNEGCKMAKWINVLAVKPEELNSIFRNCLVERGLTPDSSDLHTFERQMQKQDCKEGAMAP